MKEQQLNLFDFEDTYSLFSLLDNEFLPNEYFEVEYKSGKGGFPKELWKTYSAFANTNTGIIVIGIKENRGGFDIEGLSDEQIENYKRQFWDGCNNPNTISRNILSNDDVRVVELKGRKLLGLRIPFANRTERPVYLTRNPFGNTYKRNYEGDYRCTENEVKRMLADSSSELQLDALILEHFTIEDLDPTSIRHFRQLFASSRSGHPWHALEDGELLRKIGAYRVDRKSRKEGITLAGLLMFGKEDSIKDQDALSDYFPDYRERLTTDEKIRWTDRIYPDGTWECNLLQFYLKVWPKISSTLPKPFQLKNDERVDETPTHIALREAFVNAIVHTDYSLSGNIIIELDTEKFVFSNPGTLLISLQQYYAGGISECRNPSLQQMFMLIGRAEKAGSGVDKIMTGWRDSHWRKPFLELEGQPDRVKLTLPMFSVIPDATLQELETIFDSVGNLTPDELTALSFCLIEGSISNQRLQYVLNMHSTDITNLLKKLCTDGYLESDKNGRWTIYKVKTKVDTSSQKVSTLGRKVDTSVKVAISIEDTNSSGFTNKKLATSDRKVDTSDRKVDTSKKMATRLSREDLEKEIITICSQDYLSMEEVANQLGKSIDYLKNKIFPDMIKNGKLKKRYPFTHNHPNQGYKANDEHLEDEN
ncbi:AAA family ATPase [Gelidibacter salicanalis]|uniref:AAA family ATPase n=1 Tax=Gelidibacter salicanalis TaxID=291193 RepID=A0A5C7AK37_9FLAO|nr:RNA-binding domain-containing protein [Gelidibacter salicanalis]TXE07903.1 AAA family ATPase [Gelidibacter salicanalis]